LKHSPRGQIARAAAAITAKQNGMHFHVSIHSSLSQAACGSLKRPKPAIVQIFALLWFLATRGNHGTECFGQD